MDATGGDPGDAELTRLSLAGDRSAFSQLMGRHKGPIHGYIRRYVRDPDDAADVLQDTFVSAWRALSSYDPGRPFDVWLRRVALNKCRDHGRRASVRRVISGLFDSSGRRVEDRPDPTADGEASLIAREDVRALEAALAALPHGLRDPLVLTVLEGLSQAEAGAVLGLSAKAVEVRVYRARAKLAATLKR
ncbi:RNA polymerase sigma factor [Caulobacter sp. S45]|uniref:RNA polymerase sigma factor n=1 Tax=Caulobacter sp. S45 TaxID=1641861 RepID=UPI0015758DDC|nr:RNA polymerase sigma factor [Caulobacter sp. S45]